MTVQLCLLEPVAVDLAEKTTLHPKPSYLTSLVEEWRHHDTSKTLSDGAEWEESLEEREEEEEESRERPGVGGEVERRGLGEGRVEEGKVSGEGRVAEWLAHPLLPLVAACLACVHSLTGLDLLTAFGVLLTLVTHLSLLFH